MKICDSDVKRVQGTYEAGEAGEIRGNVVIDGVRYPYYGPETSGKFSGGMLLKDIGGYTKDHVFSDADISKCTPDDLRRRDNDLLKERIANALSILCSIVLFVVLVIIFSKFTIGQFPGILAYPIAVGMACLFMWIAEITFFILGIFINGF